jgi:hypothetical protein
VPSAAAAATAFVSAITSTAAASVLGDVVVYMFVDGNMHGVWFVDVDGMVLLDLNLVRFLDVDRDEFLHSNGNLLFDFLRDQLVDGHRHGLRHRDADRVRLRYRDFDDLGHGHPDGMRHRHPDLLHDVDGHGLGVLDGLGRDLVVLAAAVVAGQVDSLPAAVPAAAAALQLQLVAAAATQLQTAATVATGVAQEAGSGSQHQSEDDRRTLKEELNEWNDAEEH